jgi:hypothetical protein
MPMRTALNWLILSKRRRLFFFGVSYDSSGCNNKRKNMSTEVLSVVNTYIAIFWVMIPLSCRWLPTFRRMVSLPSSGWKS